MSVTFQSSVTAFCGSSRSTNVPLSSTYYIAAAGGVTTATENVQKTAMGRDGTVKWAVIKTSTTQSGTGSLVCTWRKNGVDTSVVITIAASSVAGLFYDNTNSFTCVAGDLVGVKLVNNATSASCAIIGSGILFHGKETSYSHMRNGLSTTGNNGTLGASTTSYTDFLGSGFNVTETSVQNVVPSSCSAVDLYIRTFNTQPATGSLVFTLRVNGVDTSVVTTISANGAAGGYFSSAVKDGIVRGDVIGLKVRNNASSASAAINTKSLYMYHSERRPRTALYCSTGNDTVNGSGTEFTTGTSGGSFSASEDQRLSGCPAYGTIRGLYVVTTSTQPATGAIAFTFRVNKVDTSIVVTVAANSVAGVYSKPLLTANVILGDRLSIKAVNSATTASCQLRFATFLTEETVA